MVPDDFQSLIPFNKDHAKQIRRMVLTPGDPLICPACDGTLQLGPAVPFDEHHIRQLRCNDCGRGTMIHDR